MREHVQHPLEPLYRSDARVLILGTMPSPKSREVGFYYGHPQNRFWRVLAALFCESVPASNKERAALALSHGIALWDVLASCDIEGASDASITNAHPNNLARIIDAAPIEHIFTTGTKAWQLFQSYDARAWAHIPATPLPSTSAANARMRLDDLISAYSVILESLEC